MVTSCQASRASNSCARPIRQDVQRRTSNQARRRHCCIPGVLQRREEALAQRVAKAAAKEEAAKNEPHPTTDGGSTVPNPLDPERFIQMETQKKERPSGISKTHQRKLEALKPKPPPPKPIIPDHIFLSPSEENFIALWDLSDTELERRVLRAKRRKAAERKALRQKQKPAKPKDGWRATRKEPYTGTSS